MSSITQVQKLYQDVINDVVKNLKQEFESEGIDDTVLQHLQNMWEIKLQELNAVAGDDDDDDDESDVRTDSRLSGEEAGASIPQVDGASDPHPETYKAVDAHIANALAHSADAAPGRRRMAQVDGADDDDGLKDDDEDDELGDDLDSSGDDEPPTDDLLLCQFEKVTRTKNKWKTTLKDGVMRLGGRDYVFHKGLGEFDW